MLIRLAALLLLSTSAPVLACLPPPPGTPEPVPPTKAERAQSIARWSSDIAYGIVVSETGDEPRCKIIHVYKGALKPGQVIRPKLTWGFEPHPCPGMVPPHPAFKGSYGVIAYRDEPELSFLPEDVLKEMFSARLIESAQAAPNR